MSRSLKKGPFIDPTLENKVVAMNDGKKEISDQNLEQTLGNCT